MILPEAWLNEIEAGTEFGKRIQKQLANGPLTIAPEIQSREKVGTALTRRIAGLPKLWIVKGCKSCQNLAEKMDTWGIAGVQANREEILKTLVSSQEMLAESLTNAGGWTNQITAAATNLIPSSVLRAGASWLLDKAIEDAKAETPDVPEQPRQRIPANRPQPRPPRSRGVRIRSTNILSTIITAQQIGLHNACMAAGPPRPDPFNATPVFHFGAHLWPVHENWKWHVDKWNKLASLITGRCVLIVVTDAQTASVDEVRARLSDRFEIFSAPNTSDGENPSFRTLQHLMPTGHNDIFLYAHGKGVRAHTNSSEPVRLWTEMMYETVIFNLKSVEKRLNDGYKLFGSFRTYGLPPLDVRHKWHYAGTFFALRAKYLPGRRVKSGYGGVEAWPGDHFPPQDAWVEFCDLSPLMRQYDLSAMKPGVLDLFNQWRVQQGEGNAHSGV